MLKQDRMQYKSPLLHSLQSNLRLQHLSRRTEATYIYWTKRFVRFCGLRHPCAMGPSRREHLGRVKALHGRDSANGGGWVEMPRCLDAKSPAAGSSWSLYSRLGGATGDRLGVRVDAEMAE